MMLQISKTIKLIFDTLRFGAKTTAEKAKPFAKLYIKGLFTITAIAVISPLPLIITGIIADWRWLIASAGIWWALWTFILLFLASPIGILIELLTGGMKGSGQRYIKWTSGLLSMGLCTSLFASVIPVRANLAMFPLLIVAALILGMFNVWMFSRKVITPLVSIIFLVLVFSFFFPTTFETLSEKISEMDISARKPERIQITYEAIKNGEIKFFRTDGKPRIWYYKARDGQMEFYNDKGHHPLYNEKLKPITADVVYEIEETLKRDMEVMRLEEQKKREEAEKAVKLREEEEERVQREKQEESERLTKQQSEKARDEFLSRYLVNRSGVNKPGVQELSILIIDEGDRARLDIAQKIGSILRTRGLNTTPPLFSDKFVSDRLFEKIYSGGADEVRKLELSRHCDYLVLGKKTVSFSEKPELENMIAARTVIQLHMISAKTGVIENSLTVSEIGAGFSKATAESAGVEKVLKKLEETNWRL